MAQDEYTQFAVRNGLAWDGICLGETSEQNPYHRFSRWNISLRSTRVLTYCNRQCSYIPRTASAFVVSHRTYNNEFRSAKSVPDPLMRKCLGVLRESSWDNVVGRKISDFPIVTPNANSFGVLIQATSPSRPSWKTVLFEIHKAIFTLENFRDFDDLVLNYTSANTPQATIDNLRESWDDYESVYTAACYVLSLEARANLMKLF